MERRTFQVLPELLRHLSSSVDPDLEFYGITLMVINRDGMLNLLRSFFYVPIGLYYTSRWLFEFLWYMKDEGIPPGGRYPCGRLHGVA